jgi:hypothetical protein
MLYATSRAILERATQILAEGDNVWITVSAISQVTNHLEQAMIPEKGEAAFQVSSTIAMGSLNLS